MLYRPLFWTSFWCEDWLHSTGYRGGVSSVLISSASSKTAFCLAYNIRKRIARGEIETATKVIGLTSRKNVAFTKKLALYDEVLEYGSFASAPSLQAHSERKWLYVDVAGNEDVNKAINAHFASRTPAIWWQVSRLVYHAFTVLVGDRLRQLRHEQVRRHSPGARGGGDVAISTQGRVVLHARVA